MRKIHTLKAPKAIGPYSQAILCGDFIFVSGQLPVDPASGSIVQGGIRAQTQQVLKNLTAILEEAGCTIQDVVRCDVFMHDLNEFKAMNEEYGAVFHTETPPARQTIQVAKLPLDAQVEISCIAHCKK